ncbi:MAG: hypothetical protein EA416_17770 [Trueperaceae bacterium]|nr:MAG: hypothetical protein EA416_17770 [Trueperaceae bacterium]
MTTRRPDPKHAAAVAAQAEGLLNDTRLDPWRSKRRRRAIVVAALAVFAAVATAAWFDRSVALLAALAVATLVTIALRRVVRGLADLPDAFVDERIRAMRNQRYLSAYRILSASLVAVLIVLYIAADGQRIGWDIAARHIHALFWSVFWVSFTLPSMLLAWNETEI